MKGDEAFGSLLPGRNYSSSDYNYGFNGKPKDDEVHGATGTSYDFGARLYDPRVGRWLSLDPMAGSFASMSPYIAFNDNPIFFIDSDGRWSTGAPTKPLGEFLRVFSAWEVAAKQQLTYYENIGDPDFPQYVEMHYDNSMLIGMILPDYQAPKQRIQHVNGVNPANGTTFSYNQDMGHYVDVGGFPMDMQHFFQLADLGQKLPDWAARSLAKNEENNQAQLDPVTEANGFSSAFAPEDMLSNYMGVVFGDAFNNTESLGDQMAAFMKEAEELFTTNDVANGKYLTAGEIATMRDMITELYGTSDFRDFRKDGGMYSPESISRINNNAREGKLPLTAPR